LRKKKNILFEEQGDEFIFFPKREAEQKELRSYYTAKEEIVLRHLLTITPVNIE